MGTPYLLEVLSDTRHSDVAYRVLLNDAIPSWGYLIEHGATTTWERWNCDQMRNDPSMNSYNHYAYGAVAEWIYRYAEGIDTVASDAGFHTIYLQPNFNSRLCNLGFSYHSPYGKVTSAWTITGSQAIWNVTIPPNTTGRMKLAPAEAKSYSIDDVPLMKLHLTHAIKDSSYEMPAGTYTFKVSRS